MNIESVILDWFQTIHTPLLDRLAVALSVLGDHGLIWILTALVMLAFPKTRRAGLAMALALISFQVLCNWGIKPLFARPRPCDLNAAVALLVERPHGHSFPSGHTASSFACAAALWSQHSRLRIPALIFAAVMGISRLYLYVHFPTDVLGGMLLGLALGWASSRLADWLAPRIARKGPVS
ncbi:MAG: phosphatase PAP2 family protein [Faecalibacterium sp.]